MSKKTDVRKNRKTGRLAFSACLLLAVCIFALALAETDLSALWNMGCRLAFDTDNVTLNGKASFLLDGTLFKSAEGSWQQDGVNSLMRVSVHTPLHDGSIRDTGFTVLGKEGMAWSWDVGTPYYSEWGVDPSSSVIRRPALKDALQLGGTALMNLFTLTGNSFVTSGEKEDGSKKYLVTISGDELPDAAQKELLPILSEITFEYGYSRPGIFTDIAEESDPYILYEDYEALFAKVYEDVCGEPQPASFWDDVMEGKEPELEYYFQVYSHIADMEYEASAREGVRYAVLHADGTVSVWEDLESYIRSTGDKQLCWDDPDGAFRAWYKKTTGTELSPAAQAAAESYVSPALTEAYWNMYEEMERDYLAIAAADPDALGIHIYADGGWQLLSTPDAVHAAQERMTVFQQLIWLMEDIRLENADLTVTADAEGNLTSVSGTVVFEITCEGNVVHTLTAELDCTAADFGSTDLDRVDTRVFPVPDWPTYYASLEQRNDPETAEEAPAEGTVVFDGVEYQTDPLSF